MEVSGKRGDLANGDIKNYIKKKKKTSQLKSRENIRLLPQERNKLFLIAL